MKQWTRPLVAIALIGIATGLFIAHSVTTQQAKPVSTTLQQTKVTQPVKPSDILYYINQERIKAGVQPLEDNPELDASAQAKCDDMVKYNYFAHVNPVTNQRPENLMRANLHLMPQYYGENLIDIPGDAQNIVHGWMMSQGHKENILDSRYIYTGIGVCHIAKYPNGTDVVEHFASNVQ